MNLSITPSNFINDLLNLVDTITGHFVESGYQAISNNIIATGLLSSILLLYIIYQLSLVYYEDAPFNGVSKHIFKVSLVFVLALNWDVFHVVIYNFVTNEPMYVSKLLVNAFSQNELSTSASLNDVWFESMKLVTGLLNNMPFSVKGVLVSFAAIVLIFLAALLFTVIALGYILLAKFFVAIYLAIAPYFILMYLFRGTQGMTQSWVQSILNYMLIPVFVSVVLLFTLSLAVVLLEPMAGQSADSGPSFTGGVMYFTASLLAAYLMFLVPQKAAALTSSLSMGALSHAGNYAKNMMSQGHSSYQGAKKLGGNLGKGASNAASSFKERQQALQTERQSRREAFKKKKNPHMNMPGVGMSKIES